MRSKTLPLATFLSALLLGGVAGAQTPRPVVAAHAPTWQGTLQQTAGAAPKLHTATHDYVLTGQADYTLHTLEDSHLAGATLKVHGRVLPDGRLEVARFFVVRAGKLYKVRYFCETCNIVVYEPGPCPCCQQPLHFQEIPQSEAEKE